MTIDTPPTRGSTTASHNDLTDILRLARLKEHRKALKELITPLETRLHNRLGDNENLIHPDTGATVATCRTETTSGGPNWFKVVTELGIEGGRWATALANNQFPPSRSRVLRTYPKQANNL